MLTDYRFEDYALWRSNAERIRRRTIRTPEEKGELQKWDTLLSIWLQGMEEMTGCKRTESTEIWNYVRKIDFAGVNAVNMTGAPQAEALFETPALKVDVKFEDNEVRDERAWALTHIGHAMAKYLPVFTVPDPENPTGIEIPFDIIDPKNSRSQYQHDAYISLIEDLNTGNVPEGTPFYEVRTKPRQVGSTTFWEKLSVILMQLIPRYKACMQFPLEPDAVEHMEKIVYDLERMHELWPEIFWAIKSVSRTKGIIVLENNSEFHIRHGGGQGLRKVGTNFNLFVASEAGKYERNSPDAWSKINTMIIPAVHPGPYNIVAWEGTNDELAFELNRLVKVALEPHSTYRFLFFGWNIIKEYVGPPITQPEWSLYGKYSDYIIMDGDRKSISEAEYAGNCGLSPGQIGFRRQKIDGLGSLDLFHQEYPFTYEESQVSGTVKFFPSAMVQRSFPSPLRKIDFVGEVYEGTRALRAREIEYSTTEKSDGRWWIFEEPQSGVYYVHAADFSDGIPGGDFTAAGIFRVDNGKQVAGCRYRGGQRNEIAVVRELVLSTLFYGWSNCFVIGELDGPGNAVRSRWIDFYHPNNYHRMLNRKTYDEHTDSMWYRQGSAVTRASALLNMRTAMADGQMYVADERWLWDAVDFIKQKNGKYSAAETVSRITGEKVRDDMVMMTSLAWEGIRTHPKRKRLVAHPPTTLRVRQTKSPKTEVEAINYNDLAGGVIGRIINGSTRR